MPPRATRRTVLLATGAASLTVACGSEDGGGSGTGSSSVVPGQELVAAADVPVGGGVVLKDEKIVVTQPVAGEFRAFSAICTHQNCLVSEVADGTVDCPCHGSRFRITDGSVERGPATRPLPEERIRVRGHSVLRA